MRTPRMPALSALVFCSGCCALVYQIGWLRELRLVFGSSTYASSAVLAVFMGGLGLGSAVLGGRADRHPRPLTFYARLELGIAAMAFLSPPLFVVIRKVYFSTGGAASLGQPLALAVRLLLSALVLGLPTFLMGGTLPALASAAESAADNRRRRVALLYGINTLGAVCGIMAATFLLLEHLGTRLTILSAAAVNLAVAAAAFLLSPRQRDAELAQSGGSESPASPRGADAPPAPGEAPLPAIIAGGAAALVGFVFFLMEIVWYRMLAPLLGGSIYTFGLVIATALLGIGVGGGLFSVAGKWAQPTVRLFAATCGLEALGLSLAFALGDRVALLALHLRTVADTGLPFLVAGWALVCAIVVLPAALVAGFQFPLLIALLGTGRRHVGRHTAAVYAWNTAGSILGSLAGGFGLLPLLGALWCWRLAVLMLVGLCAALLAISRTGAGGRLSLVALSGIPAVAALLIAGPGPSAAWRHSAIGTGGIVLRDGDPNTVRAWLNHQRGVVIWEKDGIESSIALLGDNALAFVVNGKVDGNARADAGTQVMGPLIGAILHQNPRKTMVIGLGTGSSAGWLAAIESVERVDVAELEPATLEVARQCGPVNRDVLANPKVHIIFGDGRETLMTSRERYDLIFSEPSNPNLPGVAGLYTREFYETVAARLAPGGMFSQWLQVYSIDPGTVRTVVATLASVFGNVETWRTVTGDLLFVCSKDRKDYDLARLAARVTSEPFRSAMLVAWGVTGLEGFLSGFFADDSFARHALDKTIAHAALNTDDLTPVEFEIIKSVGRGLLFSLREFRQETRAREAHRPMVRGGSVDWGLVDEMGLLSDAWSGNWWEDAPTETGLDRIYTSYLSGNLDAELRAWGEGWRKPASPLEAVMHAEALAEAGDARALSLLPQFSHVWPATAAVIEARLLVRQGNPSGAYAALSLGISGFREAPWDPPPIIRRSLKLCAELAERQPLMSRGIYDLLAKPFSVRNFDMDRIDTLFNVAALIDCHHGEQVLAQLEPNVFWEEGLLRFRSACYTATGNPLAASARRELEAFLAGIGSAERPVDPALPGISRAKPRD